MAPAGRQGPVWAARQDQQVVQESTPTAAMPATDAPAESHYDLPPGRRLRSRVVDGQLVIYIGPGSSKAVRSMGCFAVCWLGFTGAMTAFVAGVGGFREMPVFFSVPFFAVFWAVGLGMFYASCRGRFGKTYVLLERDRLVIKSELFGRERFRQYVLNQSSRAELVESYRDNDRPVYAVGVSTAGKRAKFATFLSPEEKAWIVDHINRHLGR
jgi:hypothetical protein